MLKVGSLYKLAGCDGYYLECFKIWEDEFKRKCARFRSTKTGWTLDAVDVQQNADYSIEWAYSKNCMFTDKTAKGGLRQRKGF